MEPSLNIPVTCVIYAPFSYMKSESKGAEAFINESTKRFPSFNYDSLDLIYLLFQFHHFLILYLRRNSRYPSLPSQPKTLLKEVVHHFADYKVSDVFSSLKVTVYLVPVLRNCRYAIVRRQLKFILEGLPVLDSGEFDLECAKFL